MPDEEVAACREADLRRVPCDDCVAKQADGRYITLLPRLFFFFFFFFSISVLIYYRAEPIASLDLLLARAACEHACRTQADTRSNALIIHTRRRASVLAVVFYYT